MIASGGRFGFAQSVFQVGGNFGTAVGPQFCPGALSSTHPVTMSCLVPTPNEGPVKYTPCAEPAPMIGGRVSFGRAIATPTTAGSNFTAYFPSGVTFPTTVYIDGTKLVVGTTGNPMTTGSTGNLFTMNLADGTGVMKLGNFAANFQGLEKDGTNYLVGNTRGHALYQVAAVGGVTAEALRMERALAGPRSL